MSENPVRYKAITPAMNEEGIRTYNEKTMGVRFDNGIGYFDDVTIDKSLGLSAKTIARRMVNDLGYEVEILDQAGQKIGNVERVEIPAEWEDDEPQPDLPVKSRGKKVVEG